MIYDLSLRLDFGKVIFFDFKKSKKKRALFSASVTLFLSELIKKLYLTDK